MNDPLTIQQIYQEGRVTLLLNGRLDAYWSGILAEHLESIVHDGQYSIRLDTSGVNYMSSAGVRVLLNYYKKLKEILGSLIIINPSSQVRSVLEMSGLMMLMTASEAGPEQAESDLSAEWSDETAKIYLETIQPSESLKGITIGTPFAVNSDITASGDLFPVHFHSALYGVGLGVLGDPSAELKSRVGEFIGMGDTIACLPTDGKKKPDYMIRYGQLVPTVNLLYGLLFEGRFSHRIRFEAVKSGGIPFSDLLKIIQKLLPMAHAGLVMIAETEGIVGASVSRSPIQDKKHKELFSFPEIRETMSFTTEPEYNRTLTVTTGIVSLGPCQTVAAFLRPISRDHGMQGHFHCAVFSYHPLKKHLDDVQEVIRMLVEQHHFETILHLVNDSRPHSGVGESTFRNGICWIGQVNNFEKPQ
jgi:anti-anti-sigma factor